MACIVFSLEDGSTFTLALDVDPFTVGRHPDNLAVIPSPSASNRHAVIHAREDGFYVQDLGSRNGTRVNGADIEEAKLNDGDRVAFGDVLAVFHEGDFEAPEEVYEEVVAPAPARPATIPQLVAGSQPVVGIPPGAGVYAPPPRPVIRRKADEGSGCMTAFLLTILFLAAFLTGLILRHYNQTNGGFLPNDLLDKAFSKASKVHIESDK